MKIVTPNVGVAKIRKLAHTRIRAQNWSEPMTTVCRRRTRQLLLHRDAHFGLVRDESEGRGDDALRVRPQGVRLHLQGLP